MYSSFIDENNKNVLSHNVNKLGYLAAKKPENKMNNRKKQPQKTKAPMHNSFVIPTIEAQQSRVLQASHNPFSSLSRAGGTEEFQFRRCIVCVNNKIQNEIMQCNKKMHLPIVCNLDIPSTVLERPLVSSLNTHFALPRRLRLVLSLDHCPAVGVIFHQT